MGEGREGDWECNGCKNRNYAFRSFCNRCKQPRLLVDTKTPADSKWLPRIGDWICSGCTNNNYASREKCKKCGQPKEIAAMPAIAMPGASVPTYSHYFDRAPGGLEQRMNIGIGSNGALQQLPLSSSWSLGGNEKFGVNSAASWPFAGNHSSGVPYENPSNQAPPVMKEWRNGDWICNCGFHNYSSRAQCKKCNASIPPGYTTLGTKRLASEEFVHDWDNKRLNSGYTNGQQKMYPGVGQVLGSAVDMKMGVYAPYAGVSSERSNGVMETGCAQIATIIIMHPVQSVIGARLKKKQWFSQSVRRSYKAAEALDCCGFAGSHCSMLAKNMKECCTPVSLP